MVGLCLNSVIHILKIICTVNTAPRKPTKSEETKVSESASKQLRSDEADTFRGVHLDPNAHHWDEVRLLALLFT